MLLKLEFHLGFLVANLQILRQPLQDYFVRQS
jgi:hypothetical protein